MDAVRTAPISLFFFIPFICGSAASCVESREILGIASDGMNRCAVYGKYSRTNEVFWYKCRGMRYKSPLVDAVPSVFATSFKAYLSSESITLIDLFWSRNKEVGLGKYSNNSLTCISLSSAPESYTSIDCSLAGITIPPEIAKSNIITGIEKVNHQNVDYTIFSYHADQDKDKLLVIDEKTKNTETSKTVTHTFTSLTNLGSSRSSGLPLVGGVTAKGLMIVYEMRALTITKVVDIRLSHQYYGCPENMCLEGDVDSVYTLSDGVPSIFNAVTSVKIISITRMYNRYKLIDVGSQLQLAESSADQQAGGINYDYDAVFAVRRKADGGHMFPNLCHIVYDPEDGGDIHCRKGHGEIVSYETSSIFPEITNKRAKIFTAIQINPTNYYFFVGDQIYHYLDIQEDVNLKMKFISVYKTRDRFKDLWKTFDAAFKDPNSNIVHFFNQDFHVRYDWRNSGMMVPKDEEPRLNQKTFWDCSANSHSAKRYIGAFGVKTLDEYYEKVAKRYRMTKLGEDETIATDPINPSGGDSSGQETKPAETGETNDEKSGQTTESKPKWVLPLIIVASITAAIILALLIIIVYYQKKRKAHSSEDSKMIRKKVPSFISVSTASPTTKTESGGKIKK